MYCRKKFVATNEIAKYIEKLDRTARRIVAKSERKRLITWEAQKENDSNKKYKWNKNVLVKDNIGY